jgi:regulatory protein
LENSYSKKAKWAKDVALEELKRWCAADEKCHAQVRTKLIEHQVYGDDLEEIISELISENFLNEARYANAYVSGKFKINGWGRNKIKMGLVQKHISSYIVNKAMSTLDQDDYEEYLKKLFTEKAKTVNIKTMQGKQKVMSFLMQRGFEQGLILSLINQKEE